MEQWVWNLVPVVLLVALVYVMYMVTGISILFTQLIGPRWCSVAIVACALGGGALMGLVGASDAALRIQRASRLGGSAIMLVMLVGTILPVMYAGKGYLKNPIVGTLTSLAFICGFVGGLVLFL